VSEMKAGTKVRMSDACKRELRAHGCREHVEEFGHCIGHVEGPVDYGNGVVGPEVNVRWQPSGLRYAYRPEIDLDVVEDACRT
jgi:hypothetical protein